MFFNAELVPEGVTGQLGEVVKLFPRCTLNIYYHQTHMLKKLPRYKSIQANISVLILPP
jgi:hypothetical protein